jgi:hypothetical protein
MAKMLVKKEAGRARDVKAFVTALADTVDNLAQRDTFMEAAKRALHRRSL